MKAIKFFRPYRLRYNARLTVIGGFGVIRQRQRQRWLRLNR